MNPLRLLIAALAIALGLSFSVSPAAAQRSVPPNTGQTFKDTSLIKPPPGAKMALFEFEDLECPACGHAHPIVMQAIEHYKIPFVRKDYPWPFHVWSTDAAIWARYMQDKLSPKVADDYRTAVFASQVSIASKDDLMAFTRRFFQQHGGQMPFVVDPTGQFRKEVMEDKAFGDRMGVSSTPTIIICTDHNWVQVTDVSQLYQAIESVQSQVASAPAMKKVSH
jgi:protein-disulfide isomerase